MSETWREEVVKLLSAFLGDPAGPVARLKQMDPNARLGLRGSTATGVVGNPYKLTFGRPWDPKDFDLDLFVVSDPLHRQYGDKILELPGVRELLVRRYAGRFEGLREGGKGVSLRIYPREASLVTEVIFFGE